MGSEDLQGYSSLTTSRADQSFVDVQGMVCRDSSSSNYSPISDISTISNSTPTVARSDSRSSEKLSVRPHDEILLCLSVAGVDSSVDHTRRRRIFKRLILVDDSSKRTKRGPLSLINEQQPPCCSRPKE